MWQRVLEHGLHRRISWRRAGRSAVTRHHKLSYRARNYRMSTHMTTSSPAKMVSSNLLPTVRNLDEARSICHEFSSVLTVGPDLSEVADFAHPDHKIVTFDDITMSFGRYRAATFEQVKHIVEWGAGRSNLLVHCHAGMSRSPTGSTRKPPTTCCTKTTRSSTITACELRMTPRRLQQSAHSSPTSSCSRISKNFLDYRAAVCAELQQPATTPSAEF